MTPQQRTELQDNMLRDHFSKMQAISDRGLANAEKWSGVVAHMCDYYNIAQEKVSDILGDELMEVLPLPALQPPLQPVDPEPPKGTP